MKLESQRRINFPVGLRKTTSLTESLTSLLSATPFNIIYFRCIIVALMLLF